MSLSLSIQEQLQFLLEQIGYIDQQYRKSNKDNRFNVFNILSKKFDEVNLHSKFLFELLNPKGSHNCNSIFLEHFINLMNISNFSLEKVLVRKEHRKIDLLISNGKQAIVIENKLWAIDQPKQLQRYYEVLMGEGYLDVRILYLSLNGKKPEEYSVGSLKGHPNFDSLVTCISYEADIEQWLERCIKEAYAKPVLRETLVQYRALIWEISGKTMYKEEMDEIVEFLAKGDNMVKAKKIAENWSYARLLTELYFWQDLEKVISLYYKISPIMKYSEDKIKSVVHNRRNQNPWYGIMFKIGTYLDADACIYIERGDGSENVYYGLGMIIGNSKEQSGDVRFKPLADKMEEFTDWHQETHWIGGNYCIPDINFANFSNLDTLKLLNDDFRSTYIAGLWQQITEFTKKVIPLIIPC